MRVGEDGQAGSAKGVRTLPNGSLILYELDELKPWSEGGGEGESEKGKLRKA